MRARTLRDSLTGLNLRGTYEEIGIGQSNVLGSQGKSSNPSFQDKRDHVASIPDASTKVDL